MQTLSVWSPNLDRFKFMSFDKGLSLPNDEIWALSKLKAFADDKFSIGKIPISLFDRVEHIVEKGENAGYQHCFHFPTMFSKASFDKVVSHNVFQSLLPEGCC